MLRPGQHWLEADQTQEQQEYYVQINEKECIPVGAVIAQDLMQEGAIAAAFVELWAGKCVLVDHNLICITGEENLTKILTEIQESNEGSLAGLPDVIALFPNGKISFREAKNIGSKDRLRKNQHQLADLLRDLFGDRLDLAVIEW
jgi:hypothetical protein